ncbi:MAG: transglutaminase family protein [Tannerella sp.]|jgi:transglutaminase-like putative cysteine protease|nr:transglutaminase family protein [Tannerella sp.]
MKRLTYLFKTRVTFSDAISNHSFLLRCVPSDNDYQKLVSGTCEVSPCCRLSRSEDVFGNLVHSGVISEPHDSFVYESGGEVTLADVYALNEPLNRIYLYPSPYTAMDERLFSMLQTVEISADMSVTDKVSMLSDAVYKNIDYAPAATTVHTTASEALAIGRGVCQDYSHILIALCRASGIASRYVAGFYEGEKYTHAWVEYYEKDGWKAIDPTNNRAVECGYVKLSHGRDYEDCSVERGVFTGIVQQHLEIQLQAISSDENSG